VPGQLAPLGPDLNLREEFIKTMRTGIDPGGHDLDGKLMPWRDIGKMDVTALYEYLTRLRCSTQSHKLKVRAGSCRTSITGALFERSVNRICVASAVEARIDLFHRNDTRCPGRQLLG
jgi:hypothetical protein